MKKNIESNKWKISSHKKAMSADQLSRKSPRNSVLDLSNRKNKSNHMGEEVLMATNINMSERRPVQRSAGNMEG